MSATLTTHVHAVILKLSIYDAKAYSRFLLPRRHLEYAQGAKSSGCPLLRTSTTGCSRAFRKRQKASRIGCRTGSEHLSEIRCRPRRPAYDAFWPTCSGRSPEHTLSFRATSTSRPLCNKRARSGDCFSLLPGSCRLRLTSP